MNEDLIYDTSLQCHATLTTLVKRGHLWKGPLCFDDIFDTLRLLYTYAIREQADQPGVRHIYKFRLKRDYSGEENMWGIIEAYKRLLGLIVFNQCELNDNILSAVGKFISLTKDFKSTLVSGLLVIIVHNESEKAIRFSDISKINQETFKRLQELIADLPSFCEIVLMPGNGFLNEQSCMQECVANATGGGNFQRYYQFSHHLDGFVRDALLREVQYLHMCIKAFQNNHNKRSNPELFPPNLTDRWKGSCIRFSGKEALSVVGVSLDVLERSELSESLRPLLNWGAHSGSPLIIQPAIIAAGKVLERLVPRLGGQPDPVAEDPPKQGESIMHEAFVWGLKNGIPDPSCQYLCRQNKLAGDLCVQLGEFEKGQSYYRKALSFSSRDDPHIWQSALLTGYAASVHLRDADIFGHSRFIDPMLRPSPLSMFLSSTILSSSGCISGLDLAATSKQDKKVPKTASNALFRAGQTIQHLRKALSIPRCVIEVMYKNADFLVSVSKRSAAIRALDSLQNEIIPRGRAFVFERYHVLAGLYTRLGLFHKAGLLQYLLENSLFDLLHQSHLRPSPALTYVSDSCLAYVDRISSGHLGSPALISAYRLCVTPAGFRRAVGSSTGVVFVCGLVSSASGQFGWPVLQLQLLVPVIKKIRLAIEQSSETIQEASWEHCTSLLGYIFSLLNGWHQHLPPMDLPNYLEILQILAKAIPADQPSLPEVDDVSPSTSREKSSKLVPVRSSFGSHLTSTLHPLVDLVELHVDKMPVVRSISIRTLPPHSLPSKMSYEALSSTVSLQEAYYNRPNASFRRKAYVRQPTFIKHPFQTSSIDTIDWVVNDLGFIEVVFDNPFAIQLKLEDVSFELAADISDPGAKRINLNSVLIIPASKSPAAEVTLKPFSGCIFEQVPLFLNHGNEPASGGYVRKVVLSPHSTRNRFVFVINVPTTLAQMDIPRWRVRTISYRLVNSGGFRVSLPLSGGQGTEGWTLYSSPQAALSEDESTAIVVDTSKALESPPPIRICPPLPRLCLLAGPCTHEKSELEVAPGSILDNMAATAPSFAPSLRLGNAMNNQETKQSVCNIVIDLHPYERRWLPIHLFVGASTCTCGGGEGGRQDDRQSQQHNHSIDCGGEMLNILHISLQTTLSANKFLQNYDLLLGQESDGKVGKSSLLHWLEMRTLKPTGDLSARTEVFVDLLGQELQKKVISLYDRQASADCAAYFSHFDAVKLPIDLIPLPSTKHCQLKDRFSLSGSCATLWLQADSSAFWDAWYQDLSAPTRFLDQQSLLAQLCIELAADVPTVVSAEENWTRVVVGRCVKVGIELRFLTSVDAPLKIIEPILSASDKTSSVDCVLKFRMNNELIPELNLLLQPSPQCSAYREELEVMFSWNKQTYTFDGRENILSMVTLWKPFIPLHEEEGEQLADAAVGLVKADKPKFKLAPEMLSLPLFRLLQTFQQAGFQPLAVATRTTDELLLPLPLPHALGRLVEHGIDIRWTSRLVVKVKEQYYSLPNVRKGRIVPISPLASPNAPPWYFSFLKNPQSVASLLWRSRIWLQLVQRFQANLPVYRMEDCPACREAEHVKDPTPQFVNKSMKPIDSTATHVVISSLSRIPLELYGGIEEDEFFNILHASLAKQFSPFVDHSKRVCEDLSENQVNYGSESALMEDLKDGLVLHRMWIGLDVFEVDKSGKSILSPKPLIEGSAFSLGGCLRGQAGLFVGKPSSLEDDDDLLSSPFGRTSTQSLKGSVVFMRTGNFFVRGYVHLMPLPFKDTSDSRTTALDFKLPPTHLFFGPIQETPHSFLFHVRE
ncbi:hypothetical protein Aperf_G00000073311 [Anoplocephala perfoliata]